MVIEDIRVKIVNLIAQLTTRPTTVSRIVILFLKASSFIRAENDREGSYANGMTICEIFVALFH